MGTKTSRSVLDFVVDEIETNKPKVEVLHSWSTPDEAVDSIEIPAEAKLMRLYYSMQGEAQPQPVASALADGDQSDKYLYRYDWTFGITVVQGHYWDWLESLRDESSLAIHLLLESVGSGPEALPVAASLNTLHPSRNTTSIYERLLKQSPRALAEVTKAGAPAHPALNYVSGAFLLASNVLESADEEQKNWYLYQFLDEARMCPAVEWRINKRVLLEYGPLLHGSVVLRFSGESTVDSHVRLMLRPQLGFFHGDEICYVAPSEKLDRAADVCLDVFPSNHAGST